MRTIFVLFLALLFKDAGAQSVTDSLGSLSFNLSDTISQKLADLAVARNPNIVVYDKRAEADLYEWQRSKVSFLNNVGASFNLNEGNLRSSKDSALANLFYPRYNLNLSLPLSTFFSRPKETKRARANYESSIALRESEVQAFKANVKRAYQIYISNRLLLRLQETVLQDEIVLFNQVQDKFEKNQVSLDAFTNASRRYNDELVKRLNLMRDANLAKIQLESLLGISLEEALAAIK